MENKPVHDTDTQRESTPKKLGNSLSSMFKRLFFGDRRQLSALEEEAIQTPGQTVFKNFRRSKLGVAGFVGFVLILAFSFVGSQLVPINLSYQETVLRNIRPGTNYLKYPAQLTKEGVKNISSGASFSIALSEAGTVFVWGTQPIQIVPNMSSSVMKIPKEVQDANIIYVAAGDRHALALSADGTLYGWGRDNFDQAKAPDLLKRRLGTKKVVDLIGGEAYSGVLFEDGELIVWGSTMVNNVDVIPLAYVGRITKVVASPHNMVFLLDDGTIGINGIRGTPLTDIPEYLQDGSVNIVDVTASYRAGLALDDTGKLHVWGSTEHGLLNIPEFEGKPIALDSGKNNITILLDTGKVVYWGADHFGQLKLPKAMENKKIVEIYSDAFQNYAVAEDGSIHAWGLKGFIFGTDTAGRDQLTRLIHGGRISLTVGAIAVVISTILGLLIGMPSGFFGGWVDQVLMRFADFVIAVPFLPLAITLSTIVVGRVSEMYRIYMIMVIIGVLSWPGLARLVRAQILVEREKDFVLAARALGVKQHNIIIRHILPNVFNLVLVGITLGYAGSLLTEAGLSFLGFGVAAPTPSWGNMLQGSQSSAVMEYYWWRWLIPGLFVIMAALSINLVGDALRDALDPKANEK